MGLAEQPALAICPRRLDAQRETANRAATAMWKISRCDLERRVLSQGAGHACAVRDRLSRSTASTTALSRCVGGAEDRGTVEFQVYGDDRRLYASGVLRGLQGSQTIEVSLEGVRTLRLVVTDGGDNYYADMANWAEARVHQAQPDAK